MTCLTPGCIYKISSYGRIFSIEVKLPFHPGWGSWNAQQAKEQKRWLHDLLEKAIAERYRNEFKK